MISRLTSTTALAGIILASALYPGAATSLQAQPAAHAAQQNVAPAAGGQASRASSSAVPMAKRDQLVQEALSALRETQNALTAINQNRQNEAIAALERATGKLEIVLARKPALALAPVDVAVTTSDVIGSLQDVERARAAAKAAIDHGRLQDARQIVDDLASETVVSVSNLPLATYPAAIKRAAALLHQNKPQEAKAVLEVALDTLVVNRVVVPLPLVRAQVAIEKARGLAEKANRTSSDNTQLHALLTTARTQLRLGDALGYGTQKNLSDLNDALDQLERKTSGQQHGTGLLDRITGLFETARNASQPSASQPGGKR